MSAIGKVLFHILFDFTRLRSGRAFPTIFLCFCFFSSVRISHEDRFIERLFGVVLFYNFLCAE